jgi:hypothetical protein
MLSLNKSSDSFQPIALTYTDNPGEGRIIYLDRNPSTSSITETKKKKALIDPIDYMGEDNFTTNRGRLGRTVKKEELKTMKNAIQSTFEDDLDEFEGETKGHSGGSSGSDSDNSEGSDDDMLPPPPTPLPERKRKIGEGKREKQSWANVPPRLRDLCRDGVKQIDDRIGREFKADMGEYVFPIPQNAPEGQDPEKFREVGYIAGPSGSGKSFYCSRFVKLWMKGHRKGNVYLFSTVPEDKALDEIDIDGRKVRRIKINESLITEPLNSDLFAGCLVIFDDVDNIVDKKIRESIQNLRNTMMSVGRHSSTSILNTSHEMSNWKATRASLTEASFVTFFPKSGSIKGILRYLESYSGLPKKQIARILDLNSRWVTIYAHYPKFVVYEHGLYLL